jgi:hypothetical protein
MSDRSLSAETKAVWFMTRTISAGAPWKRSVRCRKRHHPDSRNADLDAFQRSEQGREVGAVAPTDLVQQGLAIHGVASSLR